MRKSARSADTMRTSLILPLRASLSGTTAPEGPRSQTFRQRSARVLRLGAGHFEHRVAHACAGALGRAAGREAGDDQPLARFGGVHAEPRSRRALHAPGLHHVIEDRPQEIDRHEHVALDRARVDLLLNEKRADRGELAVGADQRRAAPLRVRRRGEERLVEHVLPVAGELALREYCRFQGVRAPAVSGHHYVLADADRRRAAALDRLHAKFAERLHQPESRRLVVGEHRAAHHRALRGREPDDACLGDEIADREDQAVLDDDAVAGALGAEDRRGESVLRDLGPQQHHGVERAIEVEAPVLGPRPHLGRERPVLLLSHG